MNRFENCGDCGVEVGQPHGENCDVARCAVTGGQRLMCELARLDTDEYDGTWVEPLIRSIPPHDSCGESVWEGMDPAPCKDCGVDVIDIDEFCYMVRSDVWPVGDDPGDMSVYLCVGCIEARLGRRLVRADFTEAPMNTFRRAQSPRLRRRFR